MFSLYTDHNFVLGPNRFIPSLKVAEEDEYFFRLRLDRVKARVAYLATALNLDTDEARIWCRVYGLWFRF